VSAVATRERVCSVDGCPRRAHARGWCGTHYQRWRRHGDLELHYQPIGTRRLNRALGYELIKIPPDHPLVTDQDRQRKVLAQRFTLYERIGGGVHACNWCDREIEWGGKGERALVADHVNGVKLDNRPENLVPSCRPCNLKRRTPRVCQLLGCGAGLAGMRRGARYCCDSHRAMAYRGETLKRPGTCAGCGAPLTSARRKWCGETCRRKAWEARDQETEGSLNGLLTVTSGSGADHVAGSVAERCTCETPIPSQRGSEPWICARCARECEPAFEVPA
jgi:hypothetical protein